MTKLQSCWTAILWVGCCCRDLKFPHKNLIPKSSQLALFKHVNTCQRNLCWIFLQKLPRWKKSVIHTDRRPRWTASLYHGAQWCPWCCRMIFDCPNFGIEHFEMSESPESREFLRDEQALVNQCLMGTANCRECCKSEQSAVSICFLWEISASQLISKFSRHFCLRSDA